MSDLSTFIDTLFDPSDLVEIRAIRGPGDVKREWHEAEDIESQGAHFTALNRDGYNIYCGVNPRSRRGGKAEDVASGRVLFADFDDETLTLDGVRHCVDAAGLPAASLIIHSGHGQHAYWLLTDRRDVATWTRYQAGLIRAFVNAGIAAIDSKVKDAARVMRLPGFDNVKSDPVPCIIVEHNAGAVYDPADVAEAVEAVCNDPAPRKPTGDALGAAMAIMPTGPERDGSSRLIRVAGIVKAAHGDDEQAALDSLEQYQAAIPFPRQYSRDELRKRLHDARPRPFALSDAGNGERFASLYAGRVRYVAAWSRWLIWSGVRWEKDDTRAIDQLAKNAARGVMNDLQTEDDPNRRKAIASHAIKSESEARLNAMLSRAASETSIAAAAADFDLDPFKLNTLTGTIDLRTGELLDHDPADNITKLAPVEYDPAATCPTFDQFIYDITCGDRKLAVYLKRLLGMMLTGDITEQILPIFWGGGRNGKSTLLDFMLYLLGDYAGVAPDGLLTDKANSEHPTEIAKLQGLRLVVASESEAGRKLRINLIKKLTGDARLTARFMRADYFDFDRTFKLVLMTNNRPRVPEDSLAIWRRLKLIPFDLQLTEAEQDTTLPARLRDEAPGILATLVRACQDWQADGLAEPAIVRAVTQDYRQSEDMVGAFLSACCVLAEGAFTPSAKLREAFESYCDEVGERAIKGREFTAQLAKLDGVSNGTGRVCGQVRRGWQGIGLMETGVHDDCNA